MIPFARQLDAAKRATSQRLEQGRFLRFRRLVGTERDDDDGLRAIARDELRFARPRTVKNR